jgi:hypothetical protein
VNALTAYAISTLCVAAPGSLFAGVSADVEGSLVITTGNYLPPGTLGRMVLTMKNNGPDIAQEVGAGTEYIADEGHRTIEMFATAETAPCLVQYTDFNDIPPNLSYIVASVTTLRDIQPGASVSCVVGIITYPEAPPVFSARFTFGSATPDPNHSNDRLFPVIQTRASVAVPASSRFALLSLALIALVSAMWSVKPQ